MVIQDVNSGNDHQKYSTYETLFEGLYRMAGDGNLWDNKNLYKSTGRYPTIPTVYSLYDSTAKTFKYQLKQSQLGSRWNSISAKQNEFNNVFSSEFNGNCYAGRYNNTWVTYNNDKCKGNARHQRRRGQFRELYRHGDTLRIDRRGIPRDKQRRVQ